MISKSDMSYIHTHLNKRTLWYSAIDYWKLNAVSSYLFRFIHSDVNILVKYKRKI